MNSPHDAKSNRDGGKLGTNSPSFPTRGGEKESAPRKAAYNITTSSKGVIADTSQNTILQSHSFFNSRLQSTAILKVAPKSTLSHAMIR